ncbi:acetyltransferase [Meira miltonrushii]|uniref:Acetyltransferase n=1 Tax=Meira miltonrushii TaxID=1280837 RepID=A0A316V897_9BASI|nr:acetyltransferase [Meira miltonrushii]PWN32701.1 acetyltransferase [Meira miltonrushii]
MEKQQPTLETSRLILRPIRQDDAFHILALGGDRDVASTTQLPHPYTEGNAKDFVEKQAKVYRDGECVNFAICAKDKRFADEIGWEPGRLMGVIGFYLNLANNRAELGYWLVKPFWGKGITFESAKAVVEYGFTDVQLNRIYANHVTRNVASGQILKKLGMRFEGTSRQHIFRWEHAEDSENYAILASEWQQNTIQAMKKA